MSLSCECNIDVDHDGEYATCYTSKMVTARKKHVCDECLKDITAGDLYEYLSMKFDGSFCVYKTCLACKSIRDIFFSSWVYTEVWESFRNEFGWTDSIIPESCISELTPGARDRVCEFIEESWED